MNSQQIKTYWLKSHQELNTYRLSQLDNPRLLKHTVDFLINCGLPESCAPGLSFDDCTRAKIPTPNEVFSIYFDELNDYLWIGSNGCGDPLCIDLNNENEIVFLNHDNDFERFFINSDIEKFSQCLIIYREFITSVNAINNSNYIERNFSDEVVKKLKNDMAAVEEKCIEEHSMWGMQLNFY